MMLVRAPPRGVKKTLTEVSGSSRGECFCPSSPCLANIN